MDRASYHWKEVIPRGSIQQTSIRASASSMSLTMQLYVAWADLKLAILHLTGTAYVIGSGAGARLSRELPAAHPRFPWLRVSEILSIRGRLGKKNQSVKRLQCGDDGWYGDWNDFEIIVQFEAPKYPMLPDEMVFAEYDRFVIKNYIPNLETLGRRGETWWIVNKNARGISPTFADDLLVRQAKGVLRWTWFQVPEAWLMLGKLYPSNIRRALSTVNLYGFPQSADNDDSGNPVRFQPGALLCMPPDIQPHSQVSKNVIRDIIDPYDFPRTFDVTFDFVDFDPPTDDDTQVITQAGPTVLVRGHNLVPLPRPNGNFRFYTAMRGPGANFVPPNPVPTDADLLYQYTDFEQLFSKAV